MADKSANPHSLCPKRLSMVFMVKKKTSSNFLILLMIARTPVGSWYISAVAMPWHLCVKVKIFFENG